MTTTKSTPTTRTTRGLRAGVVAATLSVAFAGAVGAVASTPAVAAPTSVPVAVVTHALVHHPTQVESWCSTSLGRDSKADPGPARWVQRLDAGEAPDAVLADLLRSPEHVSGAVATIHRAYLGRGLGPGAVSWVDRVLRGDSTPEGVEQDVAGSDELALATSGELEDRFPL